MAAEIKSITEFLNEPRQCGDFQPYAYYGDEEDALVVYFKDEPDYRKRINSRVTVFLSLKDDELTGCQIKSVRHVLEDIGDFDVTIKHGKVQVNILFLAYRNDFSEDPSAQKMYRSLGKSLSKTPLEFDIPQSLGSTNNAI